MQEIIEDKLKPVQSTKKQQNQPIKDYQTTQENVDTLQGQHIQSPLNRDEEYQAEDQRPTEGQWFGINRQIYRPSKTTIPIKTGLDYQLLPQSPTFIQYQEEPAYMYEPKPYNLQEAIKKEIQLICFMSTLMNKIIYDTDEYPPKTKGLNPKEYGVSVLPYYLPTSQTDTTLIFEARFECGNLRRAIQLDDFSYQLILRNDFNTIGNTQWFYFSVANTRKEQEYKFYIINLMKPDSLYNKGMKPLFYSQKMAKNKGIGWFRDGHGICYYQNCLKRKATGEFYSTLVFKIKFPYNNDTVYIAQCYPYTYSHLQNYFKSIEQCPRRKHLFQRKTLCQTIAGNNCDYLIISDFNNGKEKKGVFLTSRVHPGQSMASYVIEYIIDFLIGNSVTAKILRENFIFKIVPMLNIDGVIVGNYRCNLAAVDLNRQWIQPSKKLHPTIYHTKQLIKRMKEERELLLYCDLHGHSRKSNCFMYGCAKDGSKKQQLFPAIVRTNVNTFSFKDCCFLIQKDREGASRIALWRELNITNSYTFEISFSGADYGKYQYRHFNMTNFRQMAQGFCISIYDMYEPEQAKVTQVSNDLEQNLLKYQKFDDADSGGDASDFEDNPGPEKKEDKKNQNIVIKKKLVGNTNSSLKKKK